MAACVYKLKKLLWKVWEDIYFQISIWFYASKLNNKFVTVIKI